MGRITRLSAWQYFITCSLRRYLNNIVQAQKEGEIRSDIHPEFLWMVTEKLYELVKEGTWKTVFSDLSQFQEQGRVLFFYGLLTRPGDKAK